MSTCASPACTLKGSWGGNCPLGEKEVSDKPWTSRFQLVKHSKIDPFS